MEAVLEHGDIQFFFRPMVQAAEADEATLGVQAFFLILSPAGGDVHRRIRVGKKRMPQTRRERFWARVERVGTLQRALGDTLEAEQYSTKTRGERFQPGARPVAHGSYELVRHDDHIHLRYTVEPFDFIDAPDELRLSEHGDHLVLFEAEPGARATWTHAGNIDVLDEERTEIVLVGAGQHEVSDAYVAGA